MFNWSPCICKNASAWTVYKKTQKIESKGPYFKDLFIYRILAPGGHKRPILNLFWKITPLCGVFIKNNTNATPSQTDITLKCLYYSLTFSFGWASQPPPPRGMTSIQRNTYLFCFVCRMEVFPISFSRRKKYFRYLSVNKFGLVYWLIFTVPNVQCAIHTAIFFLNFVSVRIC